MKQNILPVEEDQSLARDPYSQAVINTDIRSLEIYRSQKKRQREMDKLKDDVSCLKSDVRELKEMILEVLKNR